MKMSDSAGVSQTAPKIDHAFVATDSKSKRPRGRRLGIRHWILIGLALVLIIGGVTAIVLRSRDDSLSGKEYEEAKTDLIELTDEANYQAGRKQSAKSVQQLERYLEQPNLPKDLKIDAQRQLAAAYYNAAMYDQSINAYHELEKTEGAPSATTAAGQAVAYKAKGDKTQAISFYEQAITLAEQELKKLKEGDGAILTYQQQVVSYKLTIKALKESQ